MSDVAGHEVEIAAASGRRSHQSQARIDCNPGNGATRVEQAQIVPGGQAEDMFDLHRENRIGIDEPDDLITKLPCHLCRANETDAGVVGFHEALGSAGKIDALPRHNAVHGLSEGFDLARIGWVDDMDMQLRIGQPLAVHDQDGAILLEIALIDRKEEHIAAPGRRALGHADFDHLPPGVLQGFQILEEPIG